MEQRQECLLAVLLYGRTRLCDQYGGRFGQRSGGEEEIFAKFL
jgi:hypothetical protein